MPDQLQRIDRYLSLRERGAAVLERMHPNLATCCDLDGLERLLDALARVALHGDRILVTPAQARRATGADGAEGAGRPGGGEKSDHPPCDAEGAEELPPEETAPGSASPETERGAEPKPEAGGAPQPAEAHPSEGALVVAQTPPVAKKGRTRGWAPGKAAKR